MINRKIIVQNITNLTDARYFAAWGVDYLSYNLKPDSPYSIELEKIKEIKDWVEGPQTLIESNSVEFMEGLDGHILDVAYSTLPLSKEAFYRTTIDDFISGVNPGNYIIKIKEADLIKLVSTMKDLRDGYNIFLDITDLDFAHLDALPDCGLVIQGGEEEKVGVKSFDDLDKLYEWLLP